MIKVSESEGIFRTRKLICVVFILVIMKESRKVKMKKGQKETASSVLHIKGCDSVLCFVPLRWI